LPGEQQAGQTTGALSSFQPKGRSGWCAGKSGDRGSEEQWAGVIPMLGDLRAASGYQR